MDRLLHELDDFDKKSIAALDFKPSSELLIEKTLLPMLISGIFELDSTLYLEKSRRKKCPTFDREDTFCLVATKISFFFE